MNGHSGCRVLLCQQKDQKFVRKISSSVSYNSRLERQMMKQRDFNHDTIKTPKIFSNGYDKDLLYFDMEFVGGIPFHNYISLNIMQNISPLFDDLCTFLNMESKTLDITDRINKKLVSIQLPNEADPYISYCRNFDWSKTPIRLGHGDLTFENIIVYRDKLYFIDFLDSFVESNLLDCSKILQDVLLSWSWREEDKAPLVKNIHLYEILKSKISEEKMEFVRRFLVLNLLRIFPYANPKTINFLNNRLEYLGKIYNI